jgi:prepilin peptidase CpaA
MQIKPILFLFLFGAVFTDLYRDRIYNIWIVPGMLIGLIMAICGGLWSFESALAAMGTSLIVLLPVYLFKGIAAGDVKLFLMAASYLSVQETLSCIFYSFLIAGAISLLIIIIKRNKRRTIHFAVPVMASAIFVIGGTL